MLLQAQSPSVTVWNAGNGMRAANHILKWSNKQTCPDPEGFIIAMIQMFKIEAQIDTPAGIELDKVCLPI